MIYSEYSHTSMRMPTMGTLLHAFTEAVLQLESRTHVSEGFLAEGIIAAKHAYAAWQAAGGREGKVQYGDAYATVDGSCDAVRVFVRCGNVLVKARSVQTETEIPPRVEIY